MNMLILQALRIASSHAPCPLYADALAAVQAMQNVDAQHEAFECWYHKEYGVPAVRRGTRGYENQIAEKLWQGWWARAST